MEIFGKCGKNRKFPEKCGNFRQNFEKNWKNKGKNWKFPEKCGNLLKNVEISEKMRLKTKNFQKNEEIFGKMR